MFSDAVRLSVDLMDQQSTILNNPSLVWGGYLAVIDRRRKNMHISKTNHYLLAKNHCCHAPLSGFMSYR